MKPTPASNTHHFMWTAGNKGACALRGVKPIKLWDVLLDLLLLGVPGSQSRLTVLRTAWDAVSRATRLWNAARWNARMFRVKVANNRGSESQAELRKALREQHARGRALGKAQRSGVEAQWSALVFIRANQGAFAQRLVQPLANLRIRYVLAQYLIPSAVVRFFRGLAVMADLVLEPSVGKKKPRWNTERDMVILMTNANQ